MPSDAACPATPFHVSTSKPSRCSARFCASFSCPPCTASGTASTTALLAVPPNTLFLAPTFTASPAATAASRLAISAAALAAAFLPILRANCAGKPVAEASAPTTPPIAVWSVFLPPYSSHSSYRYNPCTASSNACGNKRYC